MKEVKIKNSKTLENFLKAISELSVAEAKKTIREDKKQPINKTKKSLSEEIAPAQQPNLPQTGAHTDALTIDNVIEKINTIRAGKSTKEAKEELDHYFAKLDPEEKKVLNSFLGSIGQIMATGAMGEEMPDPEVETDTEIIPDEELRNRPREKAVVRDEDGHVPEEEDEMPIQTKGTYESLRKNVKQMLFKD